VRDARYCLAGCISTLCKIAAQAHCTPTRDDADERVKPKLQNMKKLEDYTPREKQHFDEMHTVLTQYNARLGTKVELPMPDYTDDQMSEYSGYRELLIAQRSQEKNVSGKS